MPSITLLAQDASEIILGALLQPTWGIYTSTGIPVIQPASFIQSPIVSQAQPLFAAVSAALGIGNILPVAASTVEFEYKQDFPISTYPQEQGAFQAYDKVTLPFDVRLRLACSGNVSTRRNFIEACLAISTSLTLYNVVTPEKTFLSVNCSHIDWRRTASRGNTLIMVDMDFLQIPVVSAVTGINTQQPGDAAQQAQGQVSAQPLSVTESQAYASGGLT